MGEVGRRLPLLGEELAEPAGEPVEGLPHLADLLGLPHLHSGTDVTLTQPPSCRRQVTDGPDQPLTQPVGDEDGETDQQHAEQGQQQPRPGHPCRQLLVGDEHADYGGPVPPDYGQRILPSPRHESRHRRLTLHGGRDQRALEIPLSEHGAIG